MAMDTALETALSSEPTVDAGTQTNTGTAPGSAAPTTPGQGASTAATQPEKTYTRAELEGEINRAVQQRLSRRSLEEHFRTQGWLTPSEAAALRQPTRPAAEPKPEADPSQQWLEQVIEARMQQALAPIQAKEVVRDLDAAITQLTTAHAELAGKENEANLREVLDTVMELGLDKAKHMTVDQILEVAYRHWRPFPDIEAIKRETALEAEKKYIDRKVDTASKTPKSEGSGGQGAVTPAKKITKKAEYEAALESALAQID